ncbi:hypothetical protein LX32DRAFT_311879 [Colletotrichum zoysiae]|uniref:Uncharacterized protein n=1 Tax=Colletotrichum zoysiae TaxID=1216348 RepID=A0AAD9LTD5_9PEZI|nr:hypothetical protein LX32DRAFT_311879 [Colletotrichum zoysiae]
MFPSAASGGQSLPGFTYHTHRNPLSPSPRGPAALSSNCPIRGSMSIGLRTARNPLVKRALQGTIHSCGGDLSTANWDPRHWAIHSQTCPTCMLHSASLFSVDERLSCSHREAATFTTSCPMNDGNTSAGLRDRQRGSSQSGSRTSWQQPPFDRLAEPSVPFSRRPPSRCHFVDWCWAEPTPNSAQLRELSRPPRSILATNLSLGGHPTYHFPPILQNTSVFRSVRAWRVTDVLIHVCISVKHQNIQASAQGTVCGMRCVLSLARRGGQAQREVKR